MSDLISRQAAIAASWFLHPDDIDALRDTLRKLPSVSPVKHGKWEKISDRNYKCSCCNAWWSVDRDSTMKDFKHCPECGAQMEIE